MWKESERGKSQFKIRDLLAVERCSQALLDFLYTTDVRRRGLAGEDVGREVLGNYRITAETERSSRERERES